MLESGLWTIDADANQLENTIINLAVNTRDAMPDGGRLTVETANSHIDEGYPPRHEHGSRSLRDVVGFRYRHGHGPGHRATRVRDPFFTTKAVGKGTGLGLSQVYGFVKQSGGRVKIYSEPGMGTTVRIYLPRHVAHAESSAPPVPPPVPRGAEQEKILVLEDHDDVPLHSVETLASWAISCSTPPTRPTALELMALHGDFDLLFTDVVLPGA